MGYYEDTDFAMSVSTSGRDVVFQPLAVVYHQEGTTFGTDATSPDKKRLMQENRVKFVSKWKRVLGAQHCPSKVGTLAMRRTAHPDLLWVGDVVPQQDSGQKQAQRQPGCCRCLPNLIIVGPPLDNSLPCRVPALDGHDAHPPAGGLRHLLPSAGDGGRPV